MSALDEMLLDSEHEREITVDTLRALLEEERNERAENRRMYAELKKQVEHLANAGIHLDLNGNGTRSFTVEVLERDENERILSIKVTL